MKKQEEWDCCKLAKRASSKAIKNVKYKVYDDLFAKLDNFMQLLLSIMR